MLSFNLKIYPPDVLVLSPSTQASEVSDSSYLSLSPTLKDNSGAGIVSSSSCLDGSGVDSFEGEEFISDVAFMNSSASTDDINWVFDLIAGVQGPVVYGSWLVKAPFCTPELCIAWLVVLFWMLLLCSFCFVSGSPSVDWVAGVDVNFRLPCLCSLSMEFCFPVLDLYVQFWLVLCLPAAVYICNDVRFSEKMELCRAAVFQLYAGMNLDMSGVLLGEGFHCLLWGPFWVRLSPLLLGRIIWVWATSTSVEWVAAAISLLEMFADDLYCGWRLVLLVEAASGCSACLGKAISPNARPSPCSPYELLVLAGWSGLPSW
ncbi:hypothetical protein Peur_025035 [Populus x canadensis]